MGVAGSRKGSGIPGAGRGKQKSEITGHFSDVSELDNPTDLRPVFFREETADQLASRSGGAGITAMVDVWGILRRRT